MILLKKILVQQAMNKNIYHLKLIFIINVSELIGRHLNVLKKFHQSLANIGNLFVCLGFFPSNVCSKSDDRTSSTFPMGKIPFLMGLISSDTTK